MDPFVDGELSRADHQVALEHLADCPVCSAEVRDLETLHRKLGELDVAGPPSHLVADIMRAVDDPAPARPIGSWLLWPAGAAATMAAMVLGFMAGVAAVAPDSPLPQSMSVQAQVAPDGMFEEPFSLLPGAEEALVVLAFDAEVEGMK